ncbi:dna-directed rna polymerase iii subunit rpc2 [Moniliophthora roreri]|nr:dna-directed rna polymerase iii subunit rpc2 [Moniliophthora roreri]
MFTVQTANGIAGGSSGIRTGNQDYTGARTQEQFSLAIYRPHQWRRNSHTSCRLSDCLHERENAIYHGVAFKSKRPARSG